MRTPYAAGKAAAVAKYAEAATGALTGALLGAVLPQGTDSVWERPLRSLGGATLGALMARDSAVDPVDTVTHTGAAHLMGSVGGGILGGFTGALVDAHVPGAHSAKSLGTLLGVGGGALAGGIAASHHAAKELEQQAKTENKK